MTSHRQDTQGGPILIGSDIFRGVGYGGRHPLAIPRVPATIDLCRALGWLPSSSYRTAPRARRAALGAFHDAAYLDALKQAEATQTVSDETRARFGLGTLSNPIYPEMFRRPATAAGGSLLGAELVARGGVVFNPGGGTHHGLADRAAGFCYVNDPVLAILALRRCGMRRIAYVDIDAHHGDGVEIAFDGAPDVRMISVHEERRWPFTGALDDEAGGSAFNLPLPAGLNDSEYAQVLDQLILPAVQSFAPEAIVLQCGADAVAEDPLARLELSNTSHWTTVHALKQLCPRLLVLGGGGYNPWTVARLWSGVWATLAGHDIPDQLPPEAQAVLGALQWNRRTRRPYLPHLITTLRDRPNHGEIRPEIPARLAHLSARLTRWY